MHITFYSLIIQLSQYRQNTYSKIAVFLAMKIHQKQRFRLKLIYESYT